MVSPPRPIVTLERIRYTLEVSSPQRPLPGLCRIDTLVLGEVATVKTPTPAPSIALFAERYQLDDESLRVFVDQGRGRGAEALSTTGRGGMTLARATSALVSAGAGASTCGNTPRGRGLGRAGAQERGGRIKREPRNLMRFSCGEIGPTIMSLMNDRALLQFVEGSINRPAPLRP